MLEPSSSVYTRLLLCDMTLVVLHKDSLVSSKEQYLLSEGDPLENEEEDAGTMPNPGAVTQAEVCD